MFELETLKDFEGYREKCDPLKGCFRTARHEENYGCLGDTGYKHICLHLKNSGKAVTRRVHRAVFEAVTGKQIPHGAHCMHLNDNRIDNRFSNLRLGTASENNLMKTHVSPRAVPNKKTAIIAIDSNGNRQHFESHSQCARVLGGSRPSIGKILDKRDHLRYYKNYWANGEKYTLIKA